ncbi:uncharacterized protein LOC124492841 [Dermatophagoides farinae]|uniref:uncharacterized protein LOC124492841 n=1 Tax=Dermatophagoides farinae TaxID=6954 RepID=UPI003F60DCA4
MFFPGDLVALTIWIIMILTSTIDKNVVLATFCPPRCKCNEVKLLVFCNETQIDLVPIMLNPQLKELYLHGNRIKNIYSSFIVYQELQYLDLSNNQIGDTGKKSFIMQKKLKVLLLNGNNLTQLNNLSFYGLESLYLLDLSHNHLSEIYSRIFMSLNKLEWLDLSSNQITHINKEAFFGLLNLKRLNLHGNQLKHIPTQSFYHLQSLVALNLSSNRFTHIPEMAFSPLAMLEELIIDSCSISAIHSRAFIHLSNLNYLDLQNNRMANVPTESFSYVTTLRTLNLSNNLITVLKRNAFKNLTHLQTLTISSCPLSQIEKDAFIDNINLNRLVIENNKKLSRIEIGTFEQQHDSLEYLSLRSNMIAFLDWQTINIKRLHYIDLQQNPLACNCSLSWLIAYLKHSNMISQSQKDQVKCYFPNYLYGKKLITLSETDLSCSKLNSTMKTVVNIFTYTAMLILIMTMMIVICRRHKRCLPFCCICRQCRFSSCCCCRNCCSTESSSSSSTTSSPSSSSTIPSSSQPIIVGNHHHHHLLYQRQYYQNQQQYHYSHQQYTDNDDDDGVQNQLPAKSRLENSFYYPTKIINDELTRDKQQIQQQQKSYHFPYRTGTMTDSTRTSALSVDLHPIPNHSLPISHI